MSQINPTVVAQSAISLVVAITAADAVRDCYHAIKPGSLYGQAIAHLIIAMILIMIVIWWFWNYPNGANATNATNTANATNATNATETFRNYTFTHN
jgi:uncharacterized membrane protein